MIFSELYSAYYNAIAEILTCLIKGEKDEATLRQAVQRHAFSDSVLTVLPSLKSQKWQLVHSDMTTPVRNIPTMPLTDLQRRWLKAVSLDPRVRLFDMDFSSLSDVEPLFTPEDYVVYDAYRDGDPYTDEQYIRNFRTILSAIKEHSTVKFETVNRSGRNISLVMLPKHLEYSQKDDKFRVICAGHRFSNTLNLARIISCRKCYSVKEYFSCEHKRETRTLTLRITDKRNALERTMLHFAHFEKQAERIDDIHYNLHLTYDKEDETELVIRVLGFGPLIEVTSPQSFRNLIIERLEKQKSCGLA
ncbi:MAG: WYL domain-containing protein [Ruminococcus sp.]|nr:WYL domain-containing protein [Ruminococcus sp.]